MAVLNPAGFAKFMGYERIQIVDWIYGLLAAIIGGGANAVVGGATINMIDPHHFNAQTYDFYKLVFAMFLANACISMFMYLKQKPLPALCMNEEKPQTAPSTLAVPQGASNGHLDL